MAVVIPTQLFPGYTSDGTSITIPLADLTGLTAAEANATSGNAMEILRTIIDKAQAQIAALTPETRPVRSSLTKAAPSIAVGTGIVPGTLRQTYTVSFDLTPTGLEPAAE
jgi:hypothetical protein